MPEIYEIIDVVGNVVYLHEIHSQESYVSLGIHTNTGTEMVTLQDQDSTIWDFGGPLKNNSLVKGTQLTLFQKIPKP